MDKPWVKQVVAGLFGGSLVAVLGAVAISLGWIDSDSADQTVVTQAPIDEDDGKKGRTVGQVYDEVGPGVVFIEAEIQGSGEPGPFGLPSPGNKQEASGSGFVLDKQGHIATNAHVVDGADEVKVKFSEDDSTDAKVVGKDTSSDIALLKVSVDGDKLKPLQLGSSKDLHVGDPVIAIGNPFGFDRTVTTGIVSALQRQLSAPNGFTIDDVVQTDAAINPGNSGGPLLDDRGRVVGINSQIASASGGSEGIGFAVPVDTLKKELPELKEKGSVDRAFLGITGLSLDSPGLADLNLPADQGVLIQDVSKDGPAEKAGLRAGDTDVTVDGQPVTLGGDVIVAVDGKKIDDMKEIVALVDEAKPGEKLEITFLRNKKKQKKSVTLGKRPDKGIN